MPNLISLAVPAFLLLVTLEVIADAIMRRDLYEIKDTAASLTMGLGNVLVNSLAKAVQFSIFTGLHRFAFFRIGYQWWAWLLIFFADDCTYYWYHRVSHGCRLFWASHVVHHSSQHYNLSTALRQTWTGSFTTFVFWLWMPAIGFPPFMIVTIGSVGLLYQFWIHTQTIRSLGPLDRVLNSPAHHRVHHACNPKYIDRNHGGTLIIWDKLFGTFEPEDPNDAPRFGLTKDIHSYNPLRIAFHEWTDMCHDVWHAPGWHNKLLYVFGNPGWRQHAELGLSRDQTTGAQSPKQATSLSKAAPSLRPIPGLDEALRRIGIHVGSAMLRHAAEQAAIAAESTLPVLLLGETETGKERFAYVIHKLSPRSEKDLVAINCAAIPASIAESYLFGHVKGSFSGAIADKTGMFEQANGSTLFLDEIAELALDIQAKLLRVIQDGMVQRIGAVVPRKVDVRIVAATNRDLAKEVAAGRFRQDLFPPRSGLC